MSRLEECRKSMLLHTYTPNPENEAELRKSSTALLSTLKEDGCLRYDLFLDLSDPGKFTFIEEWTSTDALDMQEIQPHHGRAARMGELLREPVWVQVVRPAVVIPWSNLCGNVLLILPLAPAWAQLPTDAASIRAERRPMSGIALFCHGAGSDNCGQPGKPAAGLPRRQTHRS